MNISAKTFNEEQFNVVLGTKTTRIAPNGHGLTKSTCRAQRARNVPDARAFVVTSYKPRASACTMRHTLSFAYSASSSTHSALLEPVRTLIPTSRTRTASYSCFIDQLLCSESSRSFHLPLTALLPYHAVHTSHSAHVLANCVRQNATLMSFSGPVVVTRSHFRRTRLLRC